MARRVYYDTRGATEADIPGALKGTFCPADADVRFDPATGIVAITTSGPWRGEEAMEPDLDDRARAVRPAADALAAAIAGKADAATIAELARARDAAERAWDAAPVMHSSGRVVETGLGVSGWGLVAVEDVDLDNDAPPEIDTLTRAKIAHAEAAPLDVAAALTVAAVR